jgi:hypothetical protein
MNAIGSRKGRAGLALLAAAGLLGCPGGGTVEPPADAGEPDAMVSGDAGFPPIDDRFLTRLDAPADLFGLEGPMRQGVKYLANTRTATKSEPLLDDCYFQNMARYAWHVAFLQSFPELAAIDYQTYLAWVLRPASRRLWGGHVRAYPNVAHPDTGAIGIVTYTIYSDPGTLRVEDILEVAPIMRGCVPFAAGFLVFLAETPDQKILVQNNAGTLAAAGVAVIFPERLVGGAAHQVYSPGEGYGTLRIVPRGQPLDDHGPRDIVIVESAPNDISVVQGLVAKEPQNGLSHTNLRLIEKGVPSVSVPAIYDSPYVASLADSLVHLVAGDDTFLLEPASLEDAERFWEARKPVIPPIQADLAETALSGYEAIDHQRSLAYGAKAANIGELFAILPPENRVAGFGIPFSRYDAFVKANGIDVRIAAAIADPRMRSDAAFKRAELKAIRTLIEDAPFSSALLDEIEVAMSAAFGAGYGTLKTRFRSSTNVEDLDALTGAGLYESHSGCLADDRDADLLGPSSCLSAEERADLEAQLARRRQELIDHPERTWLIGILADIEKDLMNERPIGRAVKKVWASLWNERAFDEREYYGVDHLQAYMGIAVNPAFVLEHASGVLITHLAVDAGDPLYRLNAQVGSESVVRPDDPLIVAEALTFRRRGDPPAVADVMVQVRSSLLGPSETVFAPAELDEIGRLAFIVHDHFAVNVYPDLQPLSMDLELKETSDGRIVIKQARPFVSFEP